jgi:tripartite-type tricarboxylate transporter receptor subunit TctC
VRLPRSLTILLTLLLVLSACGTGQGSPSEDEAPSEEPPESAPVASESAEWTPEYVDGVLQPLPDGFPSEPITLTVADLPESSDGVYARHTQQALRDISPVPVEVVDLGDQGSYPTWEAIQWTLDQPGGDQGYYPMIHVVPGLVIDTLTVDLEGELDMSLEDDIHFLNVTETTPFILLTRLDAPWGNSFEEMIEYCRENPGTIKYVSRSPGSTGYLAMERVKLLQDCEFDQRAGGSHDENIAAVGAGEMDIVMTQVTNALSHYEAGAVDVLAFTGSDRVGEPWEHVPSFAELGMPNEPWAQNRGWLVHPSVPDLHKAWLEEMFRAVQEDEEYQANRQTIPGVVLYSPPWPTEDVVDLAMTSIEAAEPTIRELNLHWDQQ